LIAGHDLDRAWKRTLDRCFLAAARRRGRPWFIAFFRRRRSHAENLSLGGGFAHDQGQVRARQAVNPRQIFALVPVRPEIIIQERAVAVFARPVLQRQGDEVAKSARRHRVLARKEPIVRVEAYIRETVHRRRNEQSARAPRLNPAVSDRPKAPERQATGRTACRLTIIRTAGAYRRLSSNHLDIRTDRWQKNTSLLFVRHDI
jgi:hypothetical protein